MGCGCSKEDKEALNISKPKAKYNKEGREPKIPDRGKGQNNSPQKKNLSIKLKKGQAKPDDGKTKIEEVKESIASLQQLMKNDIIERTEEDLIRQEIYMDPSKLVELSILNEKEFMSQIKTLKINNLTRFFGFEQDHQLVLQSGRQVSTYYWNPFVFALVTDKVNIYNFIMKEVNFNIKELVGIDNFKDQQAHSNTFTQERDRLTEVLQLMIENNSSLLKLVLNDLSHLIKSSHLKCLISFICKSTDPAKFFDILINSKTFTSIYIQKVKTISSQKYKYSFEFFFEKYFMPHSADQKINRRIGKLFCIPPFNVGFGSSLVLNYDKSSKTFGNLERLIAKCLDIREFDVCQLGNLTEIDFQHMSNSIQKEAKPEVLSYYSKFISNLKAKIDSRWKIQRETQELLQFVKDGDLPLFKKKVGSDFCKEQLSIMTGLKSEKDYEIRIVSLNHVHSINFFDLNSFELACVFGHPDILLYLTQELGLKSSKDFQLIRKGSSIEKLNFLLAPIFKQDSTTFELLLDLSHLWSYEDFIAILTLLKQSKWLLGFEIALNSKLAQEIFLNRSFQQKFRFVRDLLIFPFMIDVNDESDNEISEILEEGNQQKEKCSSIRKNILNVEEKIQLRKIIKTRLSEEPYIGAFLFQEFAQRRDTYKEIAEENIIPERFEEQVAYLKKCVESLSEMDMHDYILETKGGIVTLLQNHIQISFSENEVEYAKTDQYNIEIQYLIDKLNTHPTLQLVISEYEHEEERENQI